MNKYSYNKMNIHSNYSKTLSWEYILLWICLTGFYKKSSGMGFTYQRPKKMY